MSNAKSCITPKNTTPMKDQIQQHSMPLHDGLSQCLPKPLKNQFTQMSQVKDFDNKRIQFEDKRLISKKLKVKRFFKQKINKKFRLNAQTRRLVSPKSPLMIFSELFKDIPIQLQEHSMNIVTGYTATFEIDGQMYTADHTSKSEAKQKACEHFLRIMLAKKIKKKEESPLEINIEDGEISTVPKPKEPLQDDFPWPLFASLAMHNLMCQWELQPDSKAINLQEKQTYVIKSPPKVKAKSMKKFPEEPKNYNPVQLLNHMKPGVKFIETIISSKTPSVFRMKCEIDNIPFTGQGSTKKAAKKECCIAAIEYFWQFDFHAEEDDFLTKK